MNASTTLFFAASMTKAHLCAAWAVYNYNIASNQSKASDNRIDRRIPMVNIIADDFVLPIQLAPRKES